MRTMTLRERNKLNTQGEIIESALKLFIEKGFDNVSVEMICENVGISRGTFFNYFPQKELIFAEMARQRLDFCCRGLGFVRCRCLFRFVRYVSRFSSVGETAGYGLIFGRESRE